MCYVPRIPGIRPELGMSNFACVRAYAFVIKELNLNDYWKAALADYQGVLTIPRSGLYTRCIYQLKIFT